MPRHNVLYLVEFNEVKDKTSGYDKPYNPSYVSDSRLLIVFDESEDVYYCFGTRCRLSDSNNRYGSYKLAFPADNITALTKWIGLLNNKFVSNYYTFEHHQIVLEHDEYEGLEFEDIYRKIGKYTELFAYDKMAYTEGDLMEQLDMLTALANF
jgi:hypothetical protein